MSKPRPLQIWDRRARKRVTEWMKDSPQTYETHPRRSLRNWLESHPLYDWALAVYQNSSLSRREISPFIRDNAIDMTPFEPVHYRSFADFFDRRFCPGARSFCPVTAELAAFAEARYFGWERLEPAQAFPVKGRALSAEAIPQCRAIQAVSWRTCPPGPTFADGLPSRSLSFGRAYTGA
jgi:phosphatidylserine decarboxylase